LTGGPGNDLVLGDGGADVYRFSRGDGSDVFSDDSSEYDTLEIYGYTPAEVTIAADAARHNSIVLTFAGTDDRLLLDQGSNTVHSFDAIVFEDGTVWNRATIEAMALASVPMDAGANEIYGYDGSETIRAGGGDDLIESRYGTDVLEFARGDGRDTVLNSYPDTLRLIDAVPADIEILGETFGDGSVTVHILGTRDAIRFENGTSGFNRIEFSDGSVWTSTEIAAAVVARPESAFGPLTIGGTTGNDTFDSTPRDEWIYGSRGDDTYNYERGDGHDFINDLRSTSQVGNIDTLNFLDIASTEIVAGHDRQDAQDLVISFRGFGGSITIDNFFETSLRYQIERFVFSDAVTLDAAAMAALAAPAIVPATSGADKIVGTDAADTIDALAGDDVVEAGAGADDITGGLGNDRLSGGDGADTYRFALGDGRDFIVDNDWVDANTLVLSGYSAGDLAFRWDLVTGRVVLDLGASGDAITFATSTEGSLSYGDGVAAFAFGDVALDDGTLLSAADVLGMMDVPASDMRFGTDAIDDVFVNDAVSTYFEDYEGSDTYAYARGDGIDAFIDWSGDAGEYDQLILHGINPGDITAITEGSYWFTVGYAESAPGAGDGGTFALNVSTQVDFGEGFVDMTGIEEVHFADGTVWTYDDFAARVVQEPQPVTSGDDAYYGSDAADTIELLGGDDFAAGNGGADTYVYTRGDGNDIYEDQAATGEVSGTIVLHDIDPAEVTVSRRFDDLAIDIAARAGDGSDAGSIRLSSYFSYAGAFEGVSLVFDDGTIVTQADLAAEFLAPQQTAGNDHVLGTEGADLFAPGPGDDLVDPVGGNDTFRYVRGDGDDIVASSYVVDGHRLELFGISPAEVSVLRHASDLVLEFSESAPGAGDGGSIRFLDGYDAAGYDMLALAAIVFEDGTTWSRADIAAAYVAGRTGGGDDAVVNAGPALTYEMGAGDDTVETGATGDTYVYRNGDGNDVIVENGGTGNVERVYVPGSGAEGGSYVSLAGPDVVDFADLDEADISYERFGDDLVVRIAADAGRGIAAGSVTIRDAFAGNAFTDTHVETLRFADESERAVSDVLAALIAAAPTAGDDRLGGSGGDDLLVGGTGDDVIDGKDGSDTYAYTRGDGNDVIFDVPGAGWYDEVDTLELHGIARADVTFVSTYNGIEVVIAESAPGAGDGGSIVVDGMAVDGMPAETGIERVVFDDGTIVGRDAIVAEVLLNAATDGDDEITGDSGANVIAGLGGNDVLDGVEGDDTYVYTRGDGYDVILETGFYDQDRLELHGIDPAEVLFEREGLRRDSPPSREKREGASRGIEIGPSGGCFTDLNPTLDARCKDGPIRNQLAGAVLDCHTTGDHAGRPSDFCPVVAIQERACAPDLNCGPGGKGFKEDGSAYTLEARNKVQAVAFERRFVRTSGGQPSIELNPCLRADTN
ncbi:MAG TPA: calcium-binding protein, partial [Kaistiaceae bacterium]|nr:calcium-binding protein [Kaistiaceae bacterium]